MGQARSVIQTAAIIGVGCALCLVTGVQPDELARYLGYELGFVVAPGWFVFKAISPRSRCGRLGELAFAWPLGLVLEIAAFSLTAALDARGLFILYPLLVALPAAVCWRARRSRLSSRPEGSSDGLMGPISFTAAQRWAIAGICIGFFAYLGLTLFAISPLPGTVPEVQYQGDLLGQMVVSAEALHHWPITQSWVAGTPFHYHYFGHIHMAAESQVTGIGVPVLFLRLTLLSLVGLLVVELSMAGRAIVGRPWAGPLCAAMFLLLPELDAFVGTPVAGINQELIWLSLSYIFGLVFVVAIATLIAALLDRSVLSRLGLSRASAWALLALLLLGAGGAKVVVIPLLASGLVLFLAIGWLKRRSVDRTALRALALCSAVFLVYIAVLYRGSGGGGLTVSLGAAFKLMSPLNAAHEHVPDALPADIAFWGIAAPAGLALLLGPQLIGLWWVVGPRRPPLEQAHVYLLSVLVVGIAGFVLLTNLGNAYFLFNALAVAIPVSVVGLYRGMSAWASGQSESRRRELVPAFAWLVLLVLVALLGWHLTREGPRGSDYLLTYGVLAAGLLFLAWRVAGASDATRPGRVALLVLAILLPASIGLGLDAVPPTLRKLRNGDHLYVDSAGLRRGVYEGDIWMRDNLDDAAVLAVSNQRTEAAKARSPLNIDTAVFAEHRTFHEGWQFSEMLRSSGDVDVTKALASPFPERQALEDRVFRLADPRALREMRDNYGVTHLVIDRRDGRVPKAVYGFGRLVFTNGALDVIALPARENCPN